jgi:uracil-DNA glycosylase
MVIGQEWGDQHAFLSQRGVDLPSSATNAMLRELLESIGIRVPPAGAPSHDSGVFLTNAALCLKDEGCQGPVRPEWFRECGVHFLRAQVELVMPRVVISLGQQAYIGLLASYGLLPAARFLDAVEGPGVVLPGGPHLFAVYHCGRRILNTHRKREQQFQDWRRIGVTLQQGGATPAAG